jgi:hypothetical protein
MIKSYKIILIVQFILLLLLGFGFSKVQYFEDVPLIPTVPLLIIGFSPLILLAISIIIQKLIVAVIYSDSENSETDKEVPNDKFWKNSFFVNVIFGALTFVLSIVSVVSNLEVGVVSSDYINRFFISLGMLFFASLIISLFLRIKDSVTEITRFLGFLMLFISIIIFLFSLYIATLNVVTVRSYNRDSIIWRLKHLFEDDANMDEESVVAAEVVEAEDESQFERESEGDESEFDYYGFNEMSFPEVKTHAYFEELFGDQKYDDAKTHDLTKIFLSSFLELQKEQSFTGIRRAIERGFAYDEEINKIDKKIRRDPEAIRGAFDIYNAVLYTFLSDKIYFDSNLNLIVDALINSHEDIYKTENPEETLDKIYKTMDFGVKKDFPDYYYNEITRYASKEFLASINKNAETNSDKDDSSTTFNSQLNTVWIYSFWARRHKEKNSDVVFDILKEVKEHYDAELNIE